jgi:hypothetical protein
LLLGRQRDEIAVQTSLQFIVENDALGLRMIEAIEISIVFRLAGLHEAVIDDLLFRDDAGFSGEPGSLLRQSE